VRNEFSMKGRRASQVGMGMILAAALAVILVPTGRSLAQGKMEKMDKPAANSLYHRMGGYDMLADIVTDFLHQLGEDKAFARFGGGRSHDSLVKSKQLVTDQLCNLTGGPCTYIGRDMKTAHAGLEITEAEWDSAIKKFEVSLDKFKIKPQEHKEFIDILQLLKADIVAKPKDYAPKGETPKS